MEKNNLVVYSGTYVTEKNCSDYLTYENNLNGDYNLYLNIDSNESYIVPLNQVGEFENLNIVIHIPVIAHSFSEYMKNYMHVKNWLKQEKEIYSIEEIKKQIKEGNRIKILSKKAF